MTPVFDGNTSYSMTVPEGGNAYFICTANTSYNASLQWRFHTEGDLPSVLPTTHSADLLVSANMDAFCSGRMGQRLSVTLEQTAVPRASDRATILQQRSALVFCGFNLTYTGTYVCVASGLSGTTVNVRASSGSEGVDEALIAALVTVGVVFLLVVGVCLLCVCRCMYKSKSRVQRMVPMESIPVTNPVFFEVIEEDPMEFPREQLRLIEVVGMFFCTCCMWIHV